MTLTQLERRRGYGRVFGKTAVFGAIVSFYYHPIASFPLLTGLQREARERYGLIKCIFLPCSRFPSCSLIFLISQTASLYSLILELRNLSQVREEYKNFGDCLTACGWILPKCWEIVGLIDGQKHTKLHWHRTMYVKMAAKIQ